MVSSEDLLNPSPQLAIIVRIIKPTKVGKVDFKEVWNELKISYKYILLAIEEGRLEVKNNNIGLFAEVFKDSERESQIENQKKRKEALARQLQNAFNSDIEELNKQREVVCKGYHFIRK